VPSLLASERSDVREFTSNLRKKTHVWLLREVIGRIRGKAFSCESSGDAWPACCPERARRLHPTRFFGRFARWM